MNFGELQTEFYSSGFSYLQQETGGPARAQRWLNQSYQELCDQERWPFLEATATGAAPLTISDLSQVVYVLETTNDQPLTEIDQANLAVLTGDLTITGTPTYYYITGGTVINLYPVSTSVQLSVRYIKNPVDMNAAGDTPIVPASFHDLIVLGAWRRGLLDDSSAGDYNFVVNEWQLRLQMMRLAQLVPSTYQRITSGSEDW